MFTWEKKGRVFNPVESGEQDWMQEQAQNPYVLVLPNVLRVYFNCRAKRDADGKSVSFPGFVDLDRNDFSKVVKVADKPIIQLGGKGSFDEFGAMEGAVIAVGDEHYLYYCGWVRMQSVPYNWAIGLGISKDGGETFEKYGSGPIFGPTYNEPFLQAGCATVKNIDGVFHAWYTSGIKWIETDSKAESMYQIMHATSSDGKNWNRNGVSIIPEIIEDEAQASPSVFYMNDKWHMIFSYRHSVDFRNKERGYRLGYASSTDLINWDRDDSMVGIDVSSSGWDSEMVCYPHVQEIDGEIYMFYCGNDFGREGFGYAKLVQK